MLLRFLVLTNCKLATDTVEHIEDDQKALREIHRILAPGRHVMISVPAFPSPFWCATSSCSHQSVTETICCRETLLRLSEVSMLAAVFFSSSYFLS